ncbi:hypothetical protein KQI63_13950 [bacterium]|nr:hypothetical protein [bacterium]
MKRLRELLIILVFLGIPLSYVQAQQSQDPGKHAIRIEFGQSNGRLFSGGFDYERTLKQTWRMRIGLSFLSSALFNDRYQKRDVAGYSTVESSLASYTYITPASLNLQVDLLRTKEVSEKTGIYYGLGVSLYFDSFNRDFYDRSQMERFDGGVGLHAQLGCEYAFNEQFSLQVQTGLSLRLNLDSYIDSFRIPEQYDFHRRLDRNGASLSTNNSSIGLCYRF